MPELNAGVGISLREEESQLYIDSAAVQNTQILQGDVSLESGTATGGTALTLIDSSKSWTADEWVGKIVRIRFNSVAEISVYGIVQANTNNTITFDDELVFRTVIDVNAGMDYEIIKTFSPAPEDIPAYLPVDLSGGNIGIVLPEITEEIVGRRILVTIIATENEDNEFPIITRGTQRIAGTSKFGVLQYKREGVNFIPITGIVPQWTDPGIFGVRRFADGYVSAQFQTSSETYVDALQYADFTLDTQRRFIAIDNAGSAEIEYTSIVPGTFNVLFRANIEQIFGSANAYLAIAKRDGITGIETIFTEREAKVEFTAFNEFISFTVAAPVELNSRDRVYPVVRIDDDDTVAINPGSSFEIRRS